MSKRRHNPEQIIRRLAEGQKLLAGGMSVEEVCREFAIAEPTWFRWMSQYGGMKPDDAKRLKELKGENTRLKKLLAEAELEKASLKQVAEGNFQPRTGNGPPSRWPKPGSGPLNACVSHDWAAPINPTTPASSPAR